MSGPEAVSGAAERGALVRRAGIVGLGTLASRLLGLFRDMALAATLGREATDAFFVAFTIPNALRQILGEGAVSSAVVPVLAKRLAEGGDDAGRDFYKKIRGLSLAALVVVCGLGILAAEPLTALFAGGYADRPAQFARTVQLTRIVFPYLFFMGSAALGMAALNAKKKFAVTAFAPALLNVAFLLACFVLVPIFKRAGLDEAHAIGWGAILGGFLQMIAQWPSLRAIGYGGRPAFPSADVLRDPHVRTALARLVPMMVGIGVYYIDLVLSRRFLSGLGPGAQSWFSWASRLCDFPQGIFVMALSTAALPSLAALAARGEKLEVAKTWAYGLRLALFVALPCSVALVALAEPIVVALFQRGAFAPEDAHQTAIALAWQGGALFTVSVVRQTIPVYHALGDTRTPVVVSILDLLAFLGLAFGLVGPFGHVGVSIAVAGSSFVQMVLLIVGLRRKLEDLRAGELVSSALRTGGASLVAGIAAWGAARVIPHDGVVLRALPGIGGGIVFLGVFVLAAWGLKSPELEALLGGVLRRLRRR